jgi:AcrR family transcriptional regulator
MAAPADTRERVLSAAAALFADRGFHGTTMRDIAQRARVNLAAAHYHFGSKETLYLAVLREQFDNITSTLARRGLALGTVGAMPKAALTELLRARIAAMLELMLGPPPGLHGLLMMREMCDPSAALPHIVEQLIAPHKRELEGIVAALAPALPAAAVERCVFSIVGQIFFYRQQLPTLLHLTGQRQLSRAWTTATAEHIAEFSLGGLRHLAATRRQRRRA